MIRLQSGPVPSVFLLHHQQQSRPQRRPISGSLLSGKELRQRRPGQVSVERSAKNRRDQQCRASRPSACRCMQPPSPPVSAWRAFDLSERDRSREDGFRRHREIAIPRSRRERLRVDRLRLRGGLDRLRIYYLSGNLRTNQSLDAFDRDRSSSADFFPDQRAISHKLVDCRPT